MTTDLIGRRTREGIVVAQDKYAYVIDPRRPAVRRTLTVEKVAQLDAQVPTDEERAVAVALGSDSLAIRQWAVDWLDGSAWARRRDAEVVAAIPADPAKLAKWMTPARYAGRATDTRKCIEDARLNLVAAIKTGSAGRIGRRRDEAIETIIAWA